MDGFKIMYRSYEHPEVVSILNKIQQKCGKQCTDWLKQTLDPLHWKAQGNAPVPAPSRDGEQVLVFMDTDVIDISTPFGASDVWSYVIQFFPEQNQTEYQRYDRDQNTAKVSAGANPTVLHGGVQVLAARGSNVNIQWSDQTSTLIGSSGTTGLLTQSKGRTIGLAGKLVDTTPVLTDGGDINCANHNENDSDESTTFVVITAADEQAYLSVRECFSYPVNAAQLLNLPGGLSHKMKDGSFVVCIVDPYVQAAMPNFTHNIYESNIPATEPNVSDLIGPKVRTGTVGPGGYAVPTYRSCRSQIKPKQVCVRGVQSTHTAQLTIYRITEVCLASNAPVNSPLVSLLRKATPYNEQIMDILVRLNRDQVSMGVADDNKNNSYLAKSFRNAGPDINDILGGMSKGMKMAPDPRMQAAGTLLEMFQGGQGGPATFVTPQNGNRVQEVKTVTTTSQGAGPFAGVKFPKKTVTTTVRPTARTSVATNYPMGTNPQKTLKNRRKREKKKLRRTMNTVM